MENTRTSQDLRLRAHGERLLQALEDQETPTTYAEILRAARALIAVKKALDLIRADDEEDVTQDDAEDEPLPPMNRRMRRMAKAMARHVMSHAPNAPPLPRNEKSSRPSPAAQGGAGG